MASRELTVRKSGGALAVIDPENLNYDLAARWAAQEAAGRRAFKGDQIKFNGQDGEWVLGFGKQAKTLKDGYELVAIYPQVVTAWQCWKGNAPEYPHVGKVFAGEFMPPRSDLGDHDKEEWKDDKFKKGEKVDPWKKVSVLFCRDQKGTKLFHVLADNISGTITIANLVQECIEEGRRKPGMLPVIALGCGNKIKGDGKSYFPPMIEIVEWVKSIDADYPEGDLMEAVEDDQDDGDQGEVTSRSRRQKPEAEEEPRRGRKPRNAEPEETEEEEDPRKAHARNTDPRKGNPGIDPSRRSDEDDEPGIRRGRRARVEEEEERQEERGTRANRPRVEPDASEEEEPEEPRRGRRARTQEPEEEEETTTRRRRRLN
jgi:hypothetical protein